MLGNITGEMVHNPILGCKDKTIKVIFEETQVYQHNTGSSVTTISNPAIQNYANVYHYGCDNGDFGFIQLKR